jgi:enoyl-CoA hydratase/carnithine racemase
MREPLRSATSELRVEEFGPVLRVTLNRPDAMNALTTDMIDAFARVIRQARADDAIRVLVVTGAGKAFCAGADLKAFNGAQDVEPGAPDFLDRAFSLFEELAAFPKPVIASLNGITLAGGLEMALCADLIVAADTARIGDAHANFGVFPGGGGAAVLPRVIPLHAAMYLLFTGKTLGAAEMKALGLVCEVHPARELAEATLALARHIAGRSPAALRRMKDVARAASDKSRRDALLHEQVMMRAHLRSHDMAEGLSAFAEKREPQFIGR